METFVFVNPKPKGKRLDGIVTWGLSPIVVVYSLQSCWTLFCNPMDCSLPSSSVHGIFRQEYRSGVLPVFSPVDLLDPGIEPASPSLPREFFTTEPPVKPAK